MAEFHDIVVTQAGLKLIALSAAMEKPIVFDRMDIGDSRPSDASAIATMTAIVDKKIEGTISDLGVVNNTDATEARYRILAKYSNSTLTTGFKISEVGVIAHVESNYYKDNGWGGYAGESVLFGYFYTDEGKEDWLPSKDTPMDDLQMGAYFSISNGASVAVYINEENNVNIITFNAHLTDVNAHKDMVGCTSEYDGERGFVPKPKAGQQDNYYLGADGAWKQVSQRSIKDIVDIIYPVGSIYTTIGSQNPNEIWSGTTWERYAAGRVLLSAGTYTENGTTYTYTAGATGGEAKHTLTAGEMPSHSHSASSSTTGAHYHGAWCDEKGNPLGLYDSNRNYAGSGSMDWNNPLGRTSTDGNHSHTISIGSTGGNGSHENRPPYSVVNVWRRTA